MRETVPMRGVQNRWGWESLHLSIVMSMWRPSSSGDFIVHAEATDAFPDLFDLLSQERDDLIPDLVLHIIFQTLELIEESPELVLQLPILLLPFWIFRRRRTTFGRK